MPAPNRVASTGGGIIDPPPLELDAAATSGDARELREQLRGWLREHRGMPAELVDDLALATYEALANAVEHAYPADHVEPWMGLAAWFERDVVAITVTDHGRWRPARDGDGYRGHGTMLMRRLTTDVDITSGPDGTTVRLRARLPRSRLGRARRTSN